MPVAIIGMHRSGTSLLAGALRLCGLTLGNESDMVPAHESNERGHWEHKAMLGLDERLLEMLGVGWTDPGVLPARWIERDDVRELESEARKLIARTFSGDDDVWGWKDPRASLLVPFWRRVVPELRFVLCVRNPLDVVASLRARDRMPARIGLTLWQYYNEVALRDTRNAPRTVVHYEDVLDDYRRALNPVLDFLGLPSLVAGSERDRAVAAFVESSLRHHHHTLEDVLRSPQTTTAVRLLYRELLRDPEAMLAVFDAVSADEAALPAATVLEREYRAQVVSQMGEVERHARYVEEEYLRSREHAARVEAEYRRVAEHARLVEERARAAVPQTRIALAPSPRAHVAAAPIHLCRAQADEAFCQAFAAHLRSLLAAHPSGADAVFMDESSYADANAPQLMRIWEERNQAEIAARPIFIVVLSQQALADEGVQAQVALARRLSSGSPLRRIIPLLVGPCDPAALAALLPDTCPIDFVRLSYADAIERLLATLADDAADATGAAPIPPVRQHPDARDATEEVAAQVRAALRSGQRDDGILDAARTRLLAEIEKRPFDSRLWRLAGRIEAARADHDAAIAAFDRARALLPVHERELRLEILDERHWQERQQKWKERLAPPGQTPVPYPPFSQAQRRDSLTCVSRYDDALDAARQTVEQSPDGVEHWLAYARLLVVTGQNPERLAAACASAKALRPDDAGLAAACERLTSRREPHAAHAQLTDLGYSLVSRDDVEVLVPPLCEVAPGPCLIGSDESRDPAAYDDERPQHEVSLPAFHIARFPVTVAEYARFVEDGYRPPDGWQWQLTMPDAPVAFVSWFDARAYAAWVAANTGAPWRLPTETEWEKAARWDKETRTARIFPWGDTFDRQHANTREAGLSAIVPVGCYPSGASPVGAEDMAGNVWEWTSSLADSYPRSSACAAASGDIARTDRVLRGGSPRDGANLARAACRSKRVPLAVGAVVGFRLARDAGR